MAKRAYRQRRRRSSVVGNRKDCNLQVMLDENYRKKSLLDADDGSSSGSDGEEEEFPIEGRGGSVVQGEKIHEKVKF